MFNNLDSTLKKVLVIFLIITLTYANIALIGNNIIQGLFSYALDEVEETIVASNQELLMNKVCKIGEEERRVIQVAIETGIENKEKPIKQSTIILKTNIIESNLVDVKVTELNRNSYTAGTWELSEDGKLTISLTNQNDTLEEKEKGLDKLLVTYVYEKNENEIETINKPVIEVKVLTYDEENLSTTMEESNFEEIDIEKELLLLNIENKDIHKTTIESGKVDYTENLKLDLSYRNEIKDITIEDIENSFYNLEEQKNEEIVLQYNKTVINKEDLVKLLGEEGKLAISDKATNKIVAEITSELLEKEETTEQKFTEGEDEEEVRSKVVVNDKTVEIEYVEEVTNIKFELTNIKAQSEDKLDISDFVIQNTKFISNINDIEKLDYLSENIKYTINEEKTVNSKITFKDTITKASLAIDNPEWVLGKANTVKYTITLDTTSEKSELFVNPMFLIELPTNVESINTPNSQFVVNNDGGAFTGKRVFTTTVLGKKYVVIMLTGNQTLETVQNGNTTIDLSLELNISTDKTETNTTTKLYYQNDTVTTYENGTSFDTDEVEISLIINNEEKEEIPEINDNYILDYDVNLQVTSSVSDIIEAGENIEYKVLVYNFENEDVTGLTLINTLPENVTLEGVTNESEDEVDYTYNNETRTITINVDSIPKATETDEMTIAGKQCYNIKVKTNKLDDNAITKELINSTEVKKEEKVLTEKQVVNTLGKRSLNVEVEELPEQIEENEEIVLILKIENKGAFDETVDINVDIPEEFSPKKYEEKILFENGETDKEGGGTLNSNFEQSSISVPVGEIYIVKIIGTIDKLDATKTITINGTVNEETLSWTTKLVKETEPIDPSTPTDPSEPEDPSNPSTPTAPNEPETPNTPTEPTDPSNPSEPVNPDNTENDVKFDLSLNQYINKITVENSEGTTTYDYKDTNFAKVEIHSKQMNGSKVTIEYKMVVKNEGTVPGYARKIVNYKPEGLEFNEELNKDWYVGDDGNLYSIVFLDKVLNPGETVELTLTLTKQMTNADGGTIKNTMEIYEATNDDDVEDINSIPGDKLDGQNDMSTTQVIIAVKTGTVILYITLAIVVVAILGIGFYKVKKVTLNKKGGC